jgi:glycosyltransferase involved in cell wall biosynthesis
MTAYNRERYIAESIESVLNSTYENFELIIVDDGSKDRTVEIVMEYASKDARIKLYVNPKNVGQFKNRNLAATYAMGKYLKYLDSDDLLYPTGLEVMTSMIEQFPEAGYGLCLVNQDESRICPFILSPEETFVYNYEKQGIFDRAPLSSIIKKEAFDKVNGFDVEAVCGDFAFWLKTAALYPVVILPSSIGWYRVHLDQEMQKTREFSKVAFEYLKAEEMFISENVIIPAEYKNKILKRNKMGQLKFCLNVLRGLKIKLFFSLWKMYKTRPREIFR